MKLGSIVEWTSSANGVTRTKRGEIVEEVPVYRISKLHIDGLARLGPGFFVCAHVIIDGKPHGPARLYWPRVSALRVVTP